MPFEITVTDTAADSLKQDLAAAQLAAEAVAAHDQVLSGKKADGWNDATTKQADSAAKAAGVLMGALAGDRFRVTVHGGDDHTTVSIQRVA